ncbi:MULTISPECIES: hypothetical protein [unclassified Solwaraspora]|uniref:hypothetical protein n=1 Tax=unclassified Solwaraspora TaxID=2627926 RepID=UPI00259B7BBA|nr:hypothetical protein [Solwaraspora sp. WMMA2056]WJK43078.1 hypothetical protein O7608_12190 [Solwaraspora sp. WMMA2056]
MAILDWIVVIASAVLLVVFGIASFSTDLPLGMFLFPLAAGTCAGIDLYARYRR